MAKFENWCISVRARYQDTFGVAPPKAPKLIDLDSRVQERMTRCGVEARALGIDTNGYDELAILAHHTLLLDDVKRGRGNLYHRYEG